MYLIEVHINDISRLRSSYKVRQLHAIGSVLTNRFTNDGDINLVVDFNPIDVSSYADNYFDFKFALQKVFNRRVDLSEDKAIKNPYFRSCLNQQRKLIYAD